MTKPVQVSVGVVFNSNGQILISRRLERSEYGGYWEFPGGKVEPGETLTEALYRELYEEVGICCQNPIPLITVPYNFSAKPIILSVYKVNNFSGTAESREGQPIKWISIDEVSDYRFPPANQAIIHALNLPQKLFITPEPDIDNIGVYLLRLTQAIQNHKPMVRLRAKNISHKQYISLAHQLNFICKTSNVKLIVDDIETMHETNADGLHLTSENLLQTDNSLNLHDKIIGGSVHNIEQAKYASKLKLHYACVSPVKHTTTHPNLTPLGWEKFTQLASIIPSPVYALGGLSQSDLNIAVEQGGQGIAGITGFI